MYLYVLGPHQSLMILEGTTDLVDLVNDQGETRFSC